ncbi:hypothetical protein [Mesorhizobium sp. WSM2561]|uniref:hypothetical protein n=1 Tax=Mesorhizobium sp. WSM2561 TaxID=1040985 RepID=UPI0004BA9D1D|nr:hypothetical protein [Mesorhizobium sp. WSM2561]
MDILDSQINAPSKWQTFEDLSCALFAEVWRDPTAQKNGRIGQPQHGVDVYGSPEWKPGTYFGVQCKGKDQGFGGKPTKAQFDIELGKAEAFAPPLGKWYFATTAEVDADLQEHARTVSAARVAVGKFEVDILGWGALKALLAKHPSVIRQFYPELAAGAADLERVAEAADAALGSIEDRLCRGSESLQLPRSDLVARASVYLAEHNIVRVTGEGGGGKSAILKRLALEHLGPLFVLKDNRVRAGSLAEYLVQLGIGETPTKLLERLGRGGNLLVLIDGADRLLLSERRGVVTDLLALAARYLDAGNWRMITSARAYQDRDLVLAALDDAGISKSASLPVDAIDKEDCEAVAEAFPAFASLLRRNDLAQQNRRLFLLRELLKLDVPPEGRITEMDLAGKWANADQNDARLTACRTKALSQMGRWLVEYPTRAPGSSVFDPEGALCLISEGTLVSDPRADAITLAFDVHEDWLIARGLLPDCDRLSERLRDSGEPLWWLRAVRLLGQLCLEQGHYVRWREVYAALEADTSIDPAWARAWLVAPLYTEASSAILDDLGSALEADDFRLIRRLLDTLLVSETRLDETLLHSPRLAHFSESQRYAIASYGKQPVWRSWVPFLRWSLPKWSNWPKSLVPQLTETARVFCRATLNIPNAHSQAIGQIVRPWLDEIEECRHLLSWSDRREPFGIDLPDRDAWKLIEENLREALIFCAESDARSVEAYLARLANDQRLGSPRRKLLKSPGFLPGKFPATWAKLCACHYLPPRRRSRNDQSILGRELFSFSDAHSAGLPDGQSCYPPGPSRAGFLELFEADEVLALDLFHRIERRASVFWRWYARCRDGEQPHALTLKIDGHTIALWGDETVYRWSRAVLGSNILGSMHLALDEWMHRQASNGRDVGDLIRLALQPNGLVATAGLCISLLKAHVNTPGAIDHAAPFLGTPRFWNYDIRKHIDDQQPTHRISYSFSERDHHFDQVEAIFERHKAQSPMSHTLMLPFRLKAGETVQAEFDALRGTWSLEDLAEDERQPADSSWVAANGERFARILSDSDQNQVEISYNEAKQRIEAHINPPAEQLKIIEAAEENRCRMGQVNRLAMWAVHSREKGGIEEGLTLEEAIELADQVMAEPPEDADDGGFGLARKMTSFAIVGAAAIVVARADMAFLDARLEWARERLEAGCQNRRSPAEEHFTVDEALLSFDPQDIGAWGLAAYACRQGNDAIERRVLELAVDRLHGLQKAVLDGLLWDANPDFARRVTFAALDVCVIDIGHFWFEGSQEKAARRMATRRLKIIKRAAKPCPTSRVPDLPPAPYRSQWVRGRKWYHPPRRIRLISPVVLDWGRVAEILTRLDWRRLTSETTGRDAFAAYLKGLVEWTRDYSEGEESRQHDRRYPFEWAHKMAREVGRFAAFHGDGAIWNSLTRFEERDHARELVGNYMEAIAHELMVSERRPDARFWSAWKPAAEWVMATAIPSRQTNYDSLDNCLEAAGFVGPRSTPIPPDWPHLADILEWIDTWQQATLHLRRAAWLSLRVVERMSLDERASIYTRWLGRLVEAHGRNPKFWQYDDLGDRAAALAKPLADHAGCDRPEIRRILAIMADAGSNAALAIVPLFAQRKGR